MDRDSQIEFMDGAEKRHDEAAIRLSSNPKFKAILRQYDSEVTKDGAPILKHA